MQKVVTYSAMKDFPHSLQAEGRRSLLVLHNVSIRCNSDFRLRAPCLQKERKREDTSRLTKFVVLRVLLHRDTFLNRLFISVLKFAAPPIEIIYDMVGSQTFSGVPNVFPAPRFSRNHVLQKMD